MDHLNEAELLGYLSRTLSSEPRSRCDAHLDDCDACRRVLAALLDLSEPELAPPGAAAGPSEERVGRYLLRGLLGMGAMGEVYRAWDPQLEREVALKVMRAGRGERDATLRLAGEARAVARLAHPNVVALYDVVEHEGSLFIAMELVEGATLAEWCATRPRSWREVYRVFEQAGRGLAAAHAAGLVHRDFKPSNVLVGADDRVRVVDFGLAEELQVARAPVEAGRGGGEPPEWPMRTGRLVGTPAYMAPELLGGGAPVEARSDQFAYCVSFYEALHGTRPFLGRTLAEKEAAIREQRLEPPLRASGAPGWLRQVISRGLAEHPEDRFPSMEALLEALSRGARRRMRWIGGATLAATALLAGTLSVAAWREARAGDCRSVEAELAGVWDGQRRRDMEAALPAESDPLAVDGVRRLAAALDRYAASWVASRTEACQATRLRGEADDLLLEARSACLDERRRELRALVEQAVPLVVDREAVGRVIQAVNGLRPPHLCLALGARPDLELAGRGLEPSQLRAAEQLHDRILEAEALWLGRRLQEQLTRSEALLEEARGLGYRPLSARALLLAGMARHRAGAHAEAQRLLHDAVLAAEAGRTDRLAAEGWIRLLEVRAAQVVQVHDEFRWEEHAQAAVERAGDPVLVLGYHVTLGAIRHAQERHEEALGHWEQGLSVAREAFGPESLETARVGHNMGVVYLVQGRLEEAEAAFLRYLALLEREVGPEHPYVYLVLSNLGSIAGERGQPLEQLGRCRRAIAIIERSYGPEHPKLVLPLINVGLGLLDLGRAEEALEQLGRASMLQEAAGSKHPRAGRVLYVVALAELALRRRAEAAVTLQRARAIYRESIGPEKQAFAQVLAAEALLELAARRPARAGALLDEAEGVAAASWTLRVAVGSARARLELARGRPAEALRQIDEVIEAFARVPAPEHPGLVPALTSAAEIRLALGEPARAIEHLERALDLGARHALTSLHLVTPRLLLAEALLAAGGDRERASALARAAEAEASGLGAAWAEEAARARGVLGASRRQGAGRR